MMTRPPCNPDGTYIGATALADFVAGHARRERSGSPRVRCISEPTKTGDVPGVRLGPILGFVVQQANIDVP